MKLDFDRRQRMAGCLKTVAWLVLWPGLLSGCAVVAVADAAVSTVVTVGKVAVKGTGALVNAMIPDGKAQAAELEKQQAALSAANHSMSALDE